MYPYTHMFSLNNIYPYTDSHILLKTATHLCTHPHQHISPYMTTHTYMYINRHISAYAIHTPSWSDTHSHAFIHTAVLTHVLLHTHTYSKLEPSAALISPSPSRTHPPQHTVPNRKPSAPVAQWPPEWAIIQEMY